MNNVDIVAGDFSVDGVRMSGLVSLNGPDTTANLFSDELVLIHGPHTMFGVLHGLEKVSLIDCISQKATDHRRGDDRQYELEVFPHFVAIGDVYVSPENKNISEIRVLMDDAFSIFYDFDAFGIVLDAEKIRGLSH